MAMSSFEFWHAGKAKFPYLIHKLLPELIKALKVLMEDDPEDFFFSV